MVAVVVMMVMTVTVAIVVMLMPVGVAVSLLNVDVLDTTAFLKEQALSLALPLGRTAAATDAV